MKYIFYFQTLTIGMVKSKIKINFTKGGEMIKGSKHYFSMFGMMISTINETLKQFLNQIHEQHKKSLPIKITIAQTKLSQKIEQNQKYQG